MNSTTKKNSIWAAAAATLVGLTLMGGCATDKSEPKDFIPAADGHRKMNQFADAQAAIGAREDATLQPFHFSGPKLNSLGQDKLDLIIPDEPDGDVVVYLNLPAGSEMTSARHDNVVAYLKGAGIEESHIKLHDGPNNENLSPSGRGLNDLPKTETGLAGGGGGAPAEGWTAKQSMPK